MISCSLTLHSSVKDPAGLRWTAAGGFTDEEAEMNYEEFLMEEEGAASERRGNEESLDVRSINLWRNLSLINNKLINILK